jgi:hypothetical protein
MLAGIVARAQPAVHREAAISEFGRRAAHRQHFVERIAGKQDKRIVPRPEVDLRAGVLVGTDGMGKDTQLSSLESLRLAREIIDEGKTPPDTALDPATYGPHVIVKPAYELASWGKNIRLFKREDVRYRAPADYPEGHHGRKGPMIAQRFIDCGRTMNCRVLTFFGVPIFSYCRRSTKPLDLGNLSQPFRQRDFMPAAPNIEIHVTRDPDILALAASAYQALPEIPLQACDILRAKDDRLYILEVNPGGGTWMFSSKAAPAYKKALGVDDLTTEFDAFETCARILVERTRAEAI